MTSVPIDDEPTENGGHFTRAPKHIGDFGEGIVIYTLVRNGFEVATVDHVGADLIAERADKRFAISVKSRMYREGSTESRGVLLSQRDVEKLDHFARRFGLTPLFAHVCNVVDEKVIHLIILPLSRVPEVMNQVKGGYRKDIRFLITDDRVSHTCWREDCLDRSLLSRFA